MIPLLNGAILITGGVSLFLLLGYGSNVDVRFLRGSHTKWFVAPGIQHVVS